MASAELGLAPDRAGGLQAGRLTRALMSTPFLGSVVAAVSWPIISIAPTVGVDPSWMAGLYLAREGGFQFGTDIVFTYGPLGFLQVPVLYDESMWMAAFLYRGFVHVAVVISLLWMARRALPLVVALGLCYVLLVTNYLEGEVVLLALVWCFATLGDRPPKLAIPVLVVGGGVLGAVELLGKANYGIVILALCVVTVLGLPERRRNFPLFAGTIVIALAALWLLAGQNVSTGPEFVSGTAQMLSGYSRSMSTNITVITWERPFALVAIALLLVGVGLATRRDPLPRRIASISLVALFAFLTFKQGFVRQGLGNTPDYFLLMLGGGITVASRLPLRISRLRHGSPAVVLLAPLAAMAIAALPTVSVWASLKPAPHATYLRQSLDALVRPAERTRLIAEGRRDMRSAYRIDPGTLRALGNRPVHIDPWEIGVAWAYRLNWRPLPVMQSYAAYTPDLDSLNAAALSGSGAPASILRQGVGTTSIDGHLPAWESPAASRSMLCHYEAVRTTANWQLLDRVGDRCGPPRSIGEVRARTGEAVRVPLPPDPRDLVYARIDGLGVEGWEGLRAFAYRGRQRTATVDGDKTWRLVPQSAGDGLILSAPDGADFPAPFALAPDARTLAVQVQGAAPRDIAMRFFAQPVRPIPHPGVDGGRGQRRIARSGKTDGR